MSPLASYFLTGGPPPSSSSSPSGSVSWWGPQVSRRWTNRLKLHWNIFSPQSTPPPQPPNLPHDVSYQLDSLSPRAQINSISWKNIKWRVSYQPGVTSLSEEIKTFQISNSLFTEFHSALTSSHLVRPAPSWPERGRLEWGVGWGGTC